MAVQLEDLLCCRSSCPWKWERSWSVSGSRGNTTEPKSLSGGSGQMLLTTSTMSTTLAVSFALSCLKCAATTQQIASRLQMHSTSMRGCQATGTKHEWSGSEPVSTIQNHAHREAFSQKVGAKQRDGLVCNDCVVLQHRLASVTAH